MPEPFEYDVFLSFASSDEKLVRPIWQRLSSNGMRVFWTSASLKKEVGNSWFDVIESSLENSRHFVVVCTPTSMKSKWVMREYKAFSEHCYEVNHRRIVPILAEGMGAKGIPLFMRDYQLGKIVDREFMEGLSGLLGGRDLQALVIENEKLKKELRSLQPLNEENEKLKKELRSLQQKWEASKDSEKELKQHYESTLKEKLFAAEREKAKLTEELNLTKLQLRSFNRLKYGGQEKEKYEVVTHNWMPKSFEEFQSALLKGHVGLSILDSQYSWLYGQILPKPLFQSGRSYKADLLTKMYLDEKTFRKVHEYGIDLVLFKPTDK